MTAAHVGPITLEYESIGDGEPLVLVMGLSGQLIHWPDAFVGLLADRGFRVIRFDNRDIGLSTKSTGTPPGTGRTIAGLLSGRLARADYEIADMADDTAGLLDQLDIARAHVVGASMGGMIAQALAIAHPGRVASLTSIMSNTGDRKHGRPSAALVRQLPRFLKTTPETRVENAVIVARLVSGPHFDADEVREMVVRSIERDPDSAGVLRQAAAIAASPDRTAELRRVTAPTLVIHGLLDKLVRPSGGAATARAVANSRLLMFPDMAHDLPEPRWPEVIDAIVANAARAPIAQHARPAATHA